MARLPSPYNQNSAVLKELYKRFYLPMVRYTPTGSNFRDWVEYCCGIDDRPILRFKTKQSVTFSGIDVARGGQYKETIPPNTFVFVRADKNKPETVEIDFIKKNKRLAWYKLHLRDWKKTKIQLKNAPFNTLRRKKLSWEAGILD